MLVAGGVIYWKPFWQNNDNSSGQKIEEKWYKELELKIYTLSSGDKLFKVMVGNVDETPFEIKDGKDNKIGTNKLAFRGYFIDDKDKVAFRLFPVIIIDANGKEVVNAAGFHGLSDFDQDPYGYLKARLVRGKLVGVVFLPNEQSAETYETFASKNLQNQSRLAVQTAFAQQWMAGMGETESQLQEGKNGDIFQVWDFDSWLNGNNMIVDSQVYKILNNKI